MKKPFIIFTCEHASKAIPREYQHLFLKKERLLSSHRGFDHGTKELGEVLGIHFKAPVVFGKFSRLLVDLNRSHTHKTAFSEITKVLIKSSKEEIIALYHYPHWEEIKTIIDDKIKKGHLVIHIGVHSFTPVLFNQIRNAEIGLLYNASRIKEAAFAKIWQQALRKQSELRIRRNYPYLGKMDGLSTGLRKIYSEKVYRGFEVEVNHSILGSKKEIMFMGKLLISTLETSLRT